MTFTEEFCDHEHRQVTRTYVSTFDDVIYCIRNQHDVIINKIVDGQGTAMLGRFTHYDVGGFYFVSASGGFYIGHSYEDYLEIV